MGDSLPDEVFFLVWAFDGGSPTRRHRLREDAEAEAKRLARQNAGQCFVVLESISAVVKREFDTVTFKQRFDPDKDIPF